MIDMAYIYADPIVKKTKYGKLESADQPLDLKAEY